MAAAPKKPTSKKDNRSVATKLKEVAVGAVKQTAKDVMNFGVGAGPAGAGAKIGAVAGRAAARALAQEASPKILKAANAAKGAGKMVVKEAEKGKKIATAAKRDVVVKSQDKTLGIKPFINRKGEESVKVATKKPTVRVVEKEVTAKTAANRTKSANQLRYGSAKAEAKRGRNAVESSELLPKFGAKTGAAAGAAGGAAAVKSKKKGK